MNLPSNAICNKFVFNVVVANKKINKNVKRERKYYQKNIRMFAWVTFPFVQIAFPNGKEEENGKFYCETVIYLFVYS